MTRRTLLTRLVHAAALAFVLVCATACPPKEEAQGSEHGEDNGHQHEEGDGHQH